MKAFTIECSTGCSCCSHENHHRGPFSSREVANQKVEVYKGMPLLASQYARQGCYSITEHEAEVLPDGRVIVGNFVAPGWADDTGDEVMRSDFSQ